MLKSVLISLLCFSCQIIHAQNHEWAPVSAEWHYTHVYAGLPPNWPFVSSYYDYNKVNSVKDTLIGNKMCRHLISEKFNCSMWGYTATEFFMYQDSGKIYHWDAQLSSFHLLMDFNANAGDSWAIPPWIHDSSNYVMDTSYAYVDSVSYVQIGNDTFKRQYVTYSLHTSMGIMNTYADSITEKLGNHRQMLPFEYALCDVEYDIGLRCYSDSSIGLYKSVPYSCDTVISVYSRTHVLHDKKEDFQIFPNPSCDYLTIKNGNSELNNYSFSIYNLTGQLIKEGRILQQNQEIDIRDLSAAVYLIHFEGDEGNFVRKLVKAEY